MRESIGGISLFNLVIVFVLLFTGYISLSINYSKAYNVKNELVNIIKNQGGICTEGADICNNFVDQIQDYFGEVSYHSHGTCQEGWYGFKRDGSISRDGAAFCVKGIPVSQNSELPNVVYYQVKVFYQLDLPILNSIFNFTVSGETSRIYSPNECEYQAEIFGNTGIGGGWCS